MASQQKSYEVERRLLSALRQSTAPSCARGGAGGAGGTTLTPMKRIPRYGSAVATVSSAPAKIRATPAARGEEESGGEERRRSGRVSGSTG